MESLISNNISDSNSFIPQRKFMLMAIEQASLAEGFAHPNPQVGAVIVGADGQTVLATGYHHKCGDLHAERDALRNAGDRHISLSGATIYVTLEPCCHFGKQPPCTQAIIESGIKRVVVGSRDPNPLVNGKGCQILRDAGIEVIQDFCREECDSINRIFFHYITHKTPYITVKYAMSADGETCCTAGESRWVTGGAARANVHRSRTNSMAIMTGIGTVLKDDPMLNVRLDEGSVPSVQENRVHFQPHRFILDSSLQIPLDCQLVKTARDIPVTVICDENLLKEHKDHLDPDHLGVCPLQHSENEYKGVCPLCSKKAGLEAMGVKILPHRTTGQGKLDLKSLFEHLGQQGIDSIFVESGGTLNGSLFFPENLVQELQVYIAPKIFGNCEGVIHSPVRGGGVDFPKDAPLASRPQIEFYGDDILLRYYFTKKGGE